MITVNKEAITIQGFEDLKEYVENMPDNVIVRLNIEDREGEEIWH